jgi:diacylglycerol kinase (ATP)
MTAKVILNPYSNRWISQARWPEADSALKATGLDFELEESQKKKQIVELVADASREGFSPIIIAGGDGSIGDAVNGLAMAAKSDNAVLGPIGILPLGSANDVAFNVGLPTDLAKAARVIANGKTRRLDLGRLNGKYFANNSAIGLEPYVTIKHERISWIKGMARYLVAALNAIMDKQDWWGEIKWDGGEFNGPLSLVSIGNGRRTGGFFMTPHADPFDGKLTVTFGYRRTRLGLLMALPRAFNESEGSVVELEGIQEIHCTRLSIHLDKPSPAHTDGELFDDWMQDFEYEIFPKKLELLVP